MLWHKAWVDTRWRFLIGLALLTLLAIGAVFGYPQVARKLLPLVKVPDADGPVARAIRQSIELSRTFRGYVWLNAFSQNFAQLGTLFAVLLGSGGLGAETAGTLFTLSLPVSRRALMATRAASGLAELFALTMIPSLVISLFAPVIGEHFSLLDAIVHGGCFFVATTLFFSLTFWLSTTVADVWRPGLIACAVAVFIGVCEAALDQVAPFGIFHVMRADSYFYNARVPWVGLLVAVALSAMLLCSAVVAIERRDF